MRLYRWFTLTCVFGALVGWSVGAGAVSAPIPTANPVSPRVIQAAPLTRLPLEPVVVKAWAQVLRARVQGVSFVSEIRINEPTGPWSAWLRAINVVAWVEPNEPGVIHINKLRLEELKKLPPCMVEVVLVHETTHVWQSIYDPNTQDAETYAYVQEAKHGFLCEWNKIKEQP